MRLKADDTKTNKSLLIAFTVRTRGRSQHVFNIISELAPNDELTTISIISIVQCERADETESERASETSSGRASEQASEQARDAM